MKNNTMEKNTLENNPSKAESANVGRAPYGKPDLRTYGSVRDLTKGGSGTKADGGNQAKK